MPKIRKNVRDALKPRDATEERDQVGSNLNDTVCGINHENAEQHVVLRNSLNKSENPDGEKDNTEENSERFNHLESPVGLKGYALMTVVPHPGKLENYVPALAHFAVVAERKGRGGV